MITQLICMTLTLKEENLIKHRVCTGVLIIKSSKKQKFEIKKEILKIIRAI